MNINEGGIVNSDSTINNTDNGKQEARFPIDNKNLEISIAKYRVEQLKKQLKEAKKELVEVEYGNK